MSDTPRKQSVILNGHKYPLVYLSPAAYKELFEKSEKLKPQKLVMRTQGQDEKDPMKNVIIEIKGFVFNGCVFSEDV
jgi:hypothetical protein